MERWSGGGEAAARAANYVTTLEIQLHNGQILPKDVGQILGGSGRFYILHPYPQGSKCVVVMHAHYITRGVPPSSHPLPLLSENHP